jgi:glyoxylase-like metal-dependent hydrolase (beta-lactamase superfamily II)
MWRLVFDMPWFFLKSVNAYLIRDHDGYALVDCGMDNEECWTQLNQQLGALNLPLTAIHTIVATHGHPDHTGMANKLREHGEKQVWLHRSEEAFIEYRRADDSKALLERWLVRFGVPASEATDMASKVREGDRSTPAVQPTDLFQGGEELHLGQHRFEVHWTPGHTPGHVCLYEPSDRLLLCGDHILEEVAPNVSLQPYTDENPMPGYLSSLEWVAELPVHMALPGHGAPLSKLRERALGLVDHQNERQDQLESLLTKTPQTAYELAQQVWADSVPNNWDKFGPRLRRNAMGTLAAHLELLVERDRVQRCEDGVVAYARKDA